MKLKGYIKKTLCMAAGMVAGVVFCSVAEAAGDVAINQVNFPDDNFRACVTSFDTDKNNVLSQAEIDAVTLINVRGKNISDLTGIASFTSLKSLNCSSNSISSISLGSNTALTYLNVGGNNLSSLDTSKNKQLRTLICDGNKIDGLNLKGNADLSYVDASGNELSTFDVSGCKVLSILNVSDNQLMSVNLKDNKALTSLDISNNQLTSINLSENDRLTNVNVSYNNIVTLDVSGLRSLTGLECSGNKIFDIKLTDTLDSLACNNNELTVIKLGGLTKLNTLDVSDNELYSLDLTANTELTSLNASGNNLAMLDLAANTKLDKDRVVVNGNKRDIFVNTAGEIITSEAGVEVERITAVKTAGAVTGQALTAEVTGTALRVENKNSIPQGIEYTFDMGNGHKADFTFVPSTKKKLIPATRTISLYMTDGKAEYPLHVATVGGNTPVTWTGANTSVVTVSKDGVLKALSTGTATVMASAPGYDSAVFTINVYKQPVGINVSAIDVQYYTGSEIKPVPVVKDGDVLLTQNTDYMLSYENNIQAGTATVVIKGCGRYSFTIKRSFSICYNIASLVADAIPDQVFTGKEITPDVSIMNGTYKLVLDKDYTLSYMNNIALGTGIVTITGKGKYAGVKIQSFNIIVPQVTNLVKSGNYKNKIILTWNKIDGVTGYRVYRYNPTTKKYAYLKQVAGCANNTYTDTGLTTGTNYRYRVRAYVTVNKVKNYGKYSTKLNTYTKFKAVSLTAKAGIKKATLKWKKITGVTGYRIYMKTGSGKFTKIKDVKGATKVSYTKTGLTKKKTYYFKVRAFKTVKGVNVFGAYSTIKTVIAK